MITLDTVHPDDDTVTLSTIPDSADSTFLSGLDLGQNTSHTNQKLRFGNLVHEHANT